MSRHISVLLWTPVLATGVVIGAAGTADASLPSGADHIAVTAGAVAANKDAHLQPAAAIQGKITARAGGGGLSTTVIVYRDGHYVRSEYSESSGNYTIDGLLAGSYTVCATGPYYFTNTTGYLGQCLGGKYFDGSRVPSGATTVSLSNGQLKSGNNISLPNAAAISGKATKVGGTAVEFGFVFAHNRSTGATFTTFTAKDGTYTADGLTASVKGYTVCIDARYSSSPGATGMLPRCYKTTAWNGSGYPSTATKVSVTLGKVTKNINVALPVAGAIAGTVRDAGNGKAIVGAGVSVRSASGASLGYASTDNKGKYTVKHLAAATGDRVCVYPRDFSTATLATHYKGKCWKNVAWNGAQLPKGTTGVSVKTGRIHTGINFMLAKTTSRLGSIAGSVTEKAHGQALDTAFVEVRTSTGTFAGSAMTNSSGAYKVTGLRASATGYVVCAYADEGTSSSTPTPNPGGWAPRCSADTAWSQVGVPGAAKRWSIGAGHWNRTGVNIALRVGGEISGAIVPMGAPATLSNVEVTLYTGGGKLIRSKISDGMMYSFTGLTPQSGASGYLVCFDGRDAITAGPVDQGYRPQCYLDKEWDGTN